MKNSIVILGGMGFLGRHLVRRLSADHNNRITIFDRTLPPSGSTQSNITYTQGDFVSGYDFDALVRGAHTVVHLISTSVPGTEKHALDEIYANLIPSVELFEACARQQVRKIVFLSSGGTVYGPSLKKPNVETDPLSPMNTYGLQKTMIEQSLRYIARSGDMDYRIIRLSNPYGPGQNPHGPLGLITKLVYQTIHHQTIHIFGDGSVVRDFIYIDDAIQGIMDVIDAGEPNSIYNIGRGIGTSVREVVETIQSVIPEPMNITYAAGRPADVPYSVLDIHKYEAISTIRNFVPLDQGIQRTSMFFRHSAS